MRRGAQLAPTVRELYERQTGLYAWLLSQEEEEEQIRGELILIEIGSDRIERDPLDLNLRAIEAGIRRRINSLIHAFKAQESLRSERRGAAETLVFPYSHKRHGQDDIIEAVDCALEQREHLLIEAATGIGKTVACLFPALRHALAKDLTNPCGQ